MIPKKLLNQRILVKVDKLEENLRGGLVIKSEVRSPISKGEVVLTAEDVDIVNVGDKIIFTRHSGVAFLADELDNNSDVYKMIQPIDILGIL